MRKIRCEVYTRVVGYFRPVTDWNDGKNKEYGDRLEFSEEVSLSSRYFVKSIPTPVSGVACIVYGMDLCSGCILLKSGLRDREIVVDYRDAKSCVEEMRNAGVRSSALLPVVIVGDVVLENASVDDVILYL